MKRLMIPALGVAALALAVLVSSSPPVRASQGPMEVTVTNTPLSVDIGTPTVRLASTAPELFRFVVTGESDLEVHNTSGKTIVIDEVSCEASTGIIPEINVFNATFTQRLQFVAFPAQTNAHALTRIYVLPTEIVTMSTICSLSGHYEPAP